MASTFASPAHWTASTSSGCKRKAASSSSCSRVKISSNPFPKGRLKAGRIPAKEISTPSSSSSFRPTASWLLSPARALPPAVKSPRPGHPFIKGCRRCISISPALLMYGLAKTAFRLPLPPGHGLACFSAVKGVQIPKLHKIPPLHHISAWMRRLFCLPELCTLCGCFTDPF